MARPGARWSEARPGGAPAAGASSAVARRAQHGESTTRGPGKAKEWGESGALEGNARAGEGGATEHGSGWRSVEVAVGAPEVAMLRAGCCAE